MYNIRQLQLMQNFGLSLSVTFGPITRVLEHGSHSNQQYMTNRMQNICILISPCLSWSPLIPFPLNVLLAKIFGIISFFFQKDDDERGLIYHLA